MIVWSGKGYLSVIVLVASLFICINILPNDQGDYGIVLSFFIAGVFSLIYGKKWNDGSSKAAIDEKTGQQVIIKNSHTLFWIQMQYWGLLFPIYGILILFQNSVVAGYISILIFALFAFSQFRNLIKNLGSSKRTEHAQEKTSKNSQLRTSPVIQEELSVSKEAINRIKNQEIERSKLTDMSKEELEDYHKKYMP